MLRNIRNWADRKPLATTALFLLAAAIYFLAPLVLSDPSQLFGNGRREVGADSFAQALWPEIRLAVAILLAVVLVGWVRRTGLTAQPRASALLLTLPFVALCVFVLFSPLLINGAGFGAVRLSASDWQSIWATCIVAVLVGFFEELLFRGVVLQSLRARMNGALAVIIAAVVFGLFHYVNWVSGQPLDVTTMQVIGAMAGGLLFGAIVLWTGSLWPSIALHAQWDASVSISQTLQLDLSPAGEVAEITFNPVSVLSNPEFLYGALLLALWVFFDRRKRRTTAN